MLCSKKIELYDDLVKQVDDFCNHCKEEHTFEYYCTDIKNGYQCVMLKAKNLQKEINQK